MGEYWQPINVTRREYVHPHHAGCGLKLGEWNFSGSGVWTRIRELLDSGQWSQDDDIRAVSDYGGDRTLLGEPDANAYDSLGDVSNLGQQSSEMSALYARARDEYADVSTGPVRSTAPATVGERLTERYLRAVDHLPLSSDSRVLVRELRRLREIIVNARPTGDSWPRDDDGPADAILAAEARAIREEEGR